MTTMLVLNSPPELEEELVDYLLSLDQVSGFTSYPVRGHGERGYLSVAEQVSGRRKRMQFEVIVAEEGVTAILSGMASAVGKGINYWQLSVQNVGRVEASGE